MCTEGLDVALQKSWQKRKKNQKQRDSKPSFCILKRKQKLKKDNKVPNRIAGE